MATIKSLRIMMVMDTRQLDRGLNNARNRLRNAATGFATAMAGVVAARQIGQSFVWGLKEAIKQEEWTLDLALLSGDANMFDKLKKAAMASPFSIDDWMMGGKRLLGAEIPAERVVKLLTMMGDIAAGTGNSMKDMALIFTQVFAKGRLQGEEMLQFMERNVSLNKALQKVLGVSQKELRKMQESGQLNAEHVAQAFEVMTDKGALFGEMMKTKMGTAMGSGVRLMNNLKVTFAEIVTMFLPMIGMLGNALARLAGDSGVLHGFIMVIGGVINVMVIAVLAIAETLNFITSITGKWFGVLIGVTLGFLALVAFVAVVGIGIAAIIVATGIWSSILTVVQTLWAGIAAAVTASTGGMNLLLGLIVALVVAAVALFAYWTGSDWLKEKAKEIANMRDATAGLNKEMERNAQLSKQASTLAVYGTQAAHKAMAGAGNDAMLESNKEQLAVLKSIKENTDPVEEHRYTGSGGLSPRMTTPNFSS